MKLKFIRKYKFAHGGTRIEEFTLGQVIENPPDRLCQVALKDKAAVDLDAAVPETKNSKHKA